MHNRALSTCAALALATTFVTAFVPVAEAKGAKCFGRAATIVGTPGDDDIEGTRAADVIVAKGGNDVIRGFKPGQKGPDGNDVICGGNGNDVIVSGSGNDKVGGGTGDDTIGGGLGNDQILGGSGDNSAYYGSSPHGVVANLATGSATGEGTDTLTGISSLFGSEFDDTLTGDGNVNFLFGNGGNDVLTGGPTSADDSHDTTDIIAGGYGDDQVNGGDGFDMVSYQDLPSTGQGVTAGVNADLTTGTSTGFGTDHLESIEAVWGSELNDVIKGDGQDNFLVPAGGDDQISGAGGFDYLIYWFAPGNVTASLATGTASGEGNDTFSGNDIEGLFGSTAGDDALTGDNKNNFIAGDAGNDQIDGGSGDDWLTGGPGNDSVNGGPGQYDIVDFSTATAAVTANLATGAASGEGTDVLSGLEAIFGSDLGDTLTGDSGVNYLFGSGGSDQINGAAGNDQIDAGEDVDNPDADTADGGGGGNDVCANAETVLQCSVVTASQIQGHPLSAGAQEVAQFRRNF